VTRQTRIARHVDRQLLTCDRLTLPPARPVAICHHLIARHPRVRPRFDRHRQWGTGTGAPGTSTRRVARPRRSSAGRRQAHIAGQLRCGWVKLSGCVAQMANQLAAGAHAVHGVDVGEVRGDGLDAEEQLAGTFGDWCGPARPVRRRAAQSRLACRNLGPATNAGQFSSRLALQRCAPSRSNIARASVSVPRAKRFCYARRCTAPRARGK
jgi:hypothetical protein